MSKRMSILFLTVLLAPSTTLMAAQIKMKSLGYDPKHLEISTGESVTWKNTALTDHSVVSEGSPAFETGIVAPGKESKPVTFDKEGEYHYHCGIHGKTMNGTITVKGIKK